MTRRRLFLFLAVGIVALVAGVLLYRSFHKAPTDCDTVHAMLDYNKEFNERAKTPAGQDAPAPVSDQQYREWANRLKGYAGQMSDETLSGNATTAADLAGRLAALVPKYRAKPDDKGLTREYAGIGIEFGNAINRLDYACLDEG